jgi:hypothetical protein
MAVATMMVKPAAGPLTDISEPEKLPIIIPPIIPAINPENNGAPEARAIPKQSGRATRNTEMPDFQSFLKNDF